MLEYEESHGFAQETRRYDIPTLTLTRTPTLTLTLA